MSITSTAQGNNTKQEKIHYLPIRLGGDLSFAKEAIQMACWESSGKIGQEVLSGATCESQDWAGLVSLHVRRVVDDRTPGT